jgi:hypothetical protein
MIRDAKAELVREKILKPDVINKTIILGGAHDADNYDWRYLTAAFLFK